MEGIIKKFEEIKLGEGGVIVYSPTNDSIVTSLNGELVVPLASAAKVAFGFGIVKWVESNRFKWNDILENISFDPNEDSKEVYPHFQGRTTLDLQDAVEIMIACHDSFVANTIATLCGGWKEINRKVNSYFNSIHITQDPTDIHNTGELNQLIELLKTIYQGYLKNPSLWSPVINGLVRQQGGIPEIPVHHLSHLTGGLPTALVNLGIIGEFHQNPLLFVVAGNDLPNRHGNSLADEKVVELITLIYKEYMSQYPL